MKKYVFSLLIFLAVFTLQAQIIDLSLWNNIRNSSYTAEDSMHIRCETIELPNIETELFHFNGDSWESSPMELVDGLTYECVIPALSGGTQNCRFRTVADTLVGMMPALVMNDAFPPQTEELSFVADDITGDSMDPQNPNLDITGNYFGYSNSRFYSAVSSDSETYPVNSGGLFPTTYFFYITVIVNPENVLLDSVGYAMVYCNIPLFIPQGLYRFNGTEFSLEAIEQIGDLEAEVVDNKLVMACNMDDLINDEFFGNWPSITNSLIVEMSTASYNLPETFLLADLSKFSLQFIDQYVIEPFTNVLPQLSDCLAIDNGASTNFSCIYFDENWNFPLIAEIDVDGIAYDLSSILLSYSDPVGFFTEVPVSGWQEATFRFSDNGYEFVEEVIENGTGITNDQLPESNLSLSNFPNPFNPFTTISFDVLQTSSFGTIEIYNIKGQKVKSFDFAQDDNNGLHQVFWNGTDDSGKAVSSGIYFAKLKTSNTELTKKMLLMK